MKLLSIFSPRASMMDRQWMVDPWFDADECDDLEALRWLTLSGGAPIKRKKCWDATHALQHKQEQQQPRKFRVVCNCPGYPRESLKAEFDKDWLVVTGRHHSKGNDEEEYTLNEFRRRFALPDNVDRDKMASFLTPSGQFVVEMPLVMPPPQDEDGADLLEECFVRVMQNKETGAQEARLRVTLPVDHIDPAKVQVSVKDREVIVRAHDEKFSFERRTTLPQGTQVDQLKCQFDSKLGNRLLLSAPIVKLEKKDDEADGWNHVPIQHHHHHRHHPHNQEHHQTLQKQPADEAIMEESCKNKENCEKEAKLDE